MFKALRTKIESEQKGQSPLRQNRAVSNTQDNLSHKKQDSNDIDLVEEPSQTIFNQLGTVTINSNNPGFENNKSTSLHDAIIPEPVGSSLESVASSQTITELRNEISRLNKQLNSMIDERNETNDQNNQLYQSIERLRRDLETEKETNSSLQSRLNHAELFPRDKDDSDGPNSLNATSRNISIKASAVEDDLIKLRFKVKELQNQLSEKNRQLKIGQQNMNDIKKALHKEISDHSKTQDELRKLKNQLSQMHGQIETKDSEILS